MTAEASGRAAPPIGRRRFLAGVLALVAPSRPAADPVPRPDVKAAYLSYYGVGDRAIRERVFALLDRTELNGIVIDVKGDRGFIPYATEVPLAAKAGAIGPVKLPDLGSMVAGLRKRDVHVIARIVAFKDNVLAQHRPDLAVTSHRTGGLWRDNEGLAWLDPFREEAWSYVIAVALEAAGKGFAEIQFDYLRFPADGDLAGARYVRATTQETRLAAISGFLGHARAALRPLGVALAVDVFGYTAFNRDDSAIGQRIEDLAPLVDVLSPMTYPSSYHRGIPGYRNPVAHPYEVVLETVRRVRERSAGAALQVRPWLQDFRDYAFDRRPFGAREVRTQIQAAEAAGAAGWMLWNPHNEYTADALRRAGDGGGRRNLS